MVDYFASREQDRKEERELAKEYHRSGIDAAKAITEIKALLEQEQKDRRKGDVISWVISALSVAIALLALFLG